MKCSSVQAPLQYLQFLSGIMNHADRHDLAGKFARIMKEEEVFFGRKGVAKSAT